MSAPKSYRVRRRGRQRDRRDWLYFKHAGTDREVRDFVRCEVFRISGERDFDLEDVAVIPEVQLVGRPAGVALWSERRLAL